MKRVLRYLLIGFIMFPVCASAQTRIGYTNGDFNRTDGVRLSSGTTQSAAIKIPASKLAKLAGQFIKFYAFSARAALTM